MTPDGDVVWEYVNPYFHPGPDGLLTNQVFRARLMRFLLCGEGNLGGHS